MPKLGRPRISDTRLRMTITLPSDVAVRLLAEVDRVRVDCPSASVAAVAAGLVADGLRARAVTRE